SQNPPAPHHTKRRCALTTPTHRVPEDTAQIPMPPLIPAPHSNAAHPWSAKAPPGIRPDRDSGYIAGPAPPAGSSRSRAPPDAAPKTATRKHFGHKPPYTHLKSRTTPPAYSSTSSAASPSFQNGHASPRPVEKPRPSHPSNHARPLH